MRTTITPREDGLFDLAFYRKDGKFARTPMSVDELRLLHDNIISVLPDLAVPEELKDAIVRAYQIINNEEITDNTSSPRPVDASQG